MSGRRLGASRARVPSGAKKKGALKPMAPRIATPGLSLDSLKPRNPWGSLLKNNHPWAQVHLGQPNCDLGQCHLAEVRAPAKKQLYFLPGSQKDQGDPKNDQQGQLILREGQGSNGIRGLRCDVGFARVALADEWFTRPASLKREAAVPFRSNILEIEHPYKVSSPPVWRQAPAVAYFQPKPLFL